jgi:hypothetical protein
MSELPGQGDESSDLRKLSDPEFFTYWAAIRNSLARTSTASRVHDETKRQYDAVAAEYHRRLSGDGVMRYPGEPK